MQSGITVVTIFAVMLLFASLAIPYHSTIAFILLIPDAEDSSFIILNVPISQVLDTCGPVQISFEKFPIV